ncbi:MAG: hypothetical protein JWR00_941 [Rubritepida sp.]|nr:hypothetical protein [Rubritepida sp.]
MRPELQALLRERFPWLQGKPRRFDDELPFVEGVGDGWFALLQALFQTLKLYARAADLHDLEVSHVEDHFGGMVFRIQEGDEFVLGATETATHMSFAVSGASGRPGRVMKGRDGKLLVLAPGEREGFGPAWNRALNPPPSAIPAGQPGAVALVRHRHASQVLDSIDVPEGWADLADALLCGLPKTCRVRRIHAWHGGHAGQLTVTWSARAPLPPYVAGSLAFAMHLAPYVDPISGTVGPVDDRGSPVWWGPGRVISGPWGFYGASTSWQSCPDTYPRLLARTETAAIPISAHHGERGDLHFEIQAEAAHRMRAIARKAGAAGCAELLAALLGLSGDRLRDASRAACSLGEIGGDGG